MAPLKYYEASKCLMKTPKESYYNDFCHIYNSLTENAPNIFNDVEVEIHYGEKDFRTTRARVDSVINPSTGEKWGDDYKWFIFDPDDEKTFIGRLLRWKNNYWLVINCNTYETFSNGCIARRCNNILRWKDEYGNTIEEPVSINYDIMEQGDYAGKDMTTVAGFEKFFCQKNKRTIHIKANMRFLFGVKENPICYRVYANGIRNFLNNVGSENYSPSVLELWMGVGYPNPDRDDYENLIADAFTNEFTLDISQDSISEAVGYETQLSATIRKNDIVMDLPVKWLSENDEVCTIDKDGNLKCVGLGDTLIKAIMVDNDKIFDTIHVVVTATPLDDYEVKITPIDYEYTNSILQGDEVIYECYLYNNNVIQDNEFTFELETDVYYKNYKFEVINPNSFKIKNIKKSGDLDIICRTSNDINYDFKVSLKGAF